MAVAMLLLFVLMWCFLCVFFYMSSMLYVVLNACLARMSTGL